MWELLVQHMVSRDVLSWLPIPVRSAYKAASRCQGFGLGENLRCALSCCCCCLLLTALGHRTTIRTRIKMLASTFRRIAAFMAVYLLLGVVAAPFDSRETYANSTALVERDLEARAPQAAPHFVVYGDKYIPGVTGPPTVAEIRVGG